jgi:dihydroorotate dehydrogenase electron transfer subunit
MQAVDPQARVHETNVIDRREPAAGIVILGVDAPELAEASAPGQFVMIVPPSGQVAATALGIYEASNRRVSVMVVVAGPRTRELAHLAVGDRLDVLGPLGNGFDLDAAGDNVALVAGGVGIASLLLPAQELVRRGKRAHLYYGARTAEALVDLEKFAEIGVGATLATDDGSRGLHGFVTGALRASTIDHSSILACGPSPMLRATAKVAGELGLRAALSLEETFACGVGACWGCIVPLARTSAQAPNFPLAAARGSSEPPDYVHARICKEGPVFWAHELRW